VTAAAPTCSPGWFVTSSPMFVIRTLTRCLPSGMRQPGRRRAVAG
jgi:hypothetical protein